MAENTTIREGFFDSLAKGAKWDVGVSINRTNPLPLDQYSVFKSETDLDAYIAGAFAYPGQILAVVGESETVIYYLDQDKVKQEVGSMPGVDGKSIKIETDADGNEYLTLVGLADAKEGASLVKKADGSIGWSATTQSELNADLEEIKSDIVGIENTLFGYIDEETKEEVPGHEDRIDALEDKFASLGGIFNYKGAIEVGVDETISDKIDFTPVSGDVVIVNGAQEYVYADGKWEPFGDPHGVEAIDGRVSTLEDKINGYTTEVDGASVEVPGLIEKVEDIKEEIGDKVELTGLYGYATIVAGVNAETAELNAKDYTDEVAEELGEAIATKADAQGTTDALALKADITYVDGQIDLVEAEIAKKADQDATTNALNLKADKTELESGLALKADKETTNSAISGLDTRLTTAESDIDKLEAAVGADGLAGRVATLEETDTKHQTAINGLTSNLGSIEDGADAGTAFGKAAAANALAKKAEGDAATAQAKADSAYALAGEAKTLAESKVSQSDYDSKIAEIEKNVSDNASAVSTKAEKSYVEEEVGKINDEVAKKADKTYVDGEISKVNDEVAKKANQSEVDGIVNTTIPAIENSVKKINEETIPALDNKKADKTFVGELPSGTSATTVVGYVDAEIDKVEQAIEDIHIPEYDIGVSNVDDNTISIVLGKDEERSTEFAITGEGKIVLSDDSDTTGFKIGVDLSDYYTSEETDAAVKVVDDKVAAMYTNAQIDGFIADAKKYADDNDANTEYGIVYDSENKVIKLVSDTSKTEIDATDFIKDGMIESVVLENNNLVITWNTDSDKGENSVTTIPLTGLVDVYTGVDGTTVKVEVSDDNKISAEVKAGTIAKSHLDANVQASLDLADNWGTAPAKGITADDIEAWDAEIGAMDLAKTKRTEAEVNAQIDAKITAQGFGSMAKKAADDYYTKTEADAAFTDATEVDGQIDAKIAAYGFGTMAKEDAADYYTAEDVDGLIEEIHIPTYDISVGSDPDDGGSVSIILGIDDERGPEIMFEGDDIINVTSFSGGNIVFSADLSNYYTKAEADAADADTHNNLDSVEASVAVANNAATITHTVAMTDGESDSSTFAIKGGYSATDGGIQITGSGNNIQIDMVWGTF